MVPNEFYPTWRQLDLSNLVVIGADIFSARIRVRVCPSAHAFEWHPSPLPNRHCTSPSLMMPVAREPLCSTTKLWSIDLKHCRGLVTHIVFFEFSPLFEFVGPCAFAALPHLVALSSCYIITIILYLSLWQQSRRGYNSEPERYSKT